MPDYPFFIRHVRRIANTKHKLRCSTTDTSTSESTMLRNERRPQSPQADDVGRYACRILKPVFLYAFENVSSIFWVQDMSLDTVCC